MIEYKQLTLNDIDTIRPFLTNTNPLSCDYTIGGLFMWRDYYGVEYAIKDDYLLIRMKPKDEEVYYNLPISKKGLVTGDLYDLMAENEPLIRIVTVPDYLLEEVLNHNNVGSYKEQDDFYDYVYDATDLSTFKGHRYNGQRNQVNHFLKTANTWSFKTVTDEIIPDIIDFFQRAYLVNAEHGSYEDEENKKVLELLDNYSNYGLIGGVLYMNSSIVGFSINEIIGQTLYTHIEKAQRTIKGAYQMLVLQNAKAFGKGVPFINREEDMGDLGLRVSKQSYHPIKTIKKYIVEVTR